MDQHFQNMDDIKNEEEIIKEAKRICEDVLYSEKARFKMANFWQIINTLFSVLTIILSITLVSFAFLDINAHILEVWFLSLITTILTMLQIFFNPYEKSKINKGLGDEYNKLRREIRIFFNINIIHNDFNENMSQLKEFEKIKFDLDNRCSPIHSCFYNAAKKSIENGEHIYKIDLEDD